MQAHDLVRPLPGDEGKAALLGDLLAVLLAPYDDLGAFSGRVRVAVPRMGVGEKSATTLALIVHELATNSVKYGAWSIPGGVVTISWTLVRDGANPTQLRVGWIERGGPVVTPPTRKGFGRMVIERMVAQKLDGAVEIEFAPQGLSWTLSLPAAHFEEALRQATPTSGNAMT